MALLLYISTSKLVTRARQKFGVAVPATTGNPDFERVFRVQMITLEWMPIFLPLLWLFALYVSDWGAAVLGLVWIVGRILYIRGYSQAADKRHLGYGIQASAVNVLLISALVGIILHIMRGG